MAKKWGFCRYGKKVGFLSIWKKVGFLSIRHDYYHDTKVKPEAATKVIELLMMGGKTPESC
jgi:hypothetical protein